MLLLLLLLQAGDPSPVDVALAGGRAVVVNSGSDRLVLVDLLKNEVVVDTPVGRRPFAVAIDGPRAVVSNQLDGTINVIELGIFHASATIAVGAEPRGVALSGNRAYVALAGEDAVAAVDLDTKTVTRAPAGVEPWDVALTPDGLAVSNARSMTVTVHDPATLAIRHTVMMRGHNLRRMAPAGEWVYVPNIAERGLSTTKANIDRGWVIANRLSRVPMKVDAPREAISLDPRGMAVGDVEDVALHGERLALAAGGTRELILLTLPLPFVAYGGPGDHIDPAVLKERFKRVPLGGRPTACVFTADGKKVVVSNYLLNALQVVDVEKAALSATIPLGGPAEPSLARKGEAIFYDAKRSFNQWYSCHSCHTDGHTNGSTFDTQNDGRYGNPKKTLSLRGVARSGPWTWHGWQTDLKTALAHSMKTTMQGPEPSKEDVDALHAFVLTLDHPRPAPKNEAAQRGEKLFKAKGCAVCHTAPDYTSEEIYVVGLEAPDDAYKGFNPPPLRGVGRRGPWLHDGRARTLEALLTKHHTPAALSEKPDLTAEELADLIAFLKSL